MKMKTGDATLASFDRKKHAKKNLILVRNVAGKFIDGESRLERGSAPNLCCIAQEIRFPIWDFFLAKCAMLFFCSKN